MGSGSGWAYLWDQQPQEKAQWLVKPLQWLQIRMSKAIRQECSLLINNPQPKRGSKISLGTINNIHGSTNSFIWTKDRSLQAPNRGVEGVCSVTTGSEGYVQ